MQNNIDSHYMHDSSEEEQQRLSLLNRLMNRAGLQTIQLQGDDWYVCCTKQLVETFATPLSFLAAVRLIRISSSSWITFSGYS